MRLLILHLENFRQHADTTVDFAEGMTAIVGPNGSGKSTLLEAITYALYGEQRDKKETIPFYWADKRRTAVSLQFELDGQKFQVERTNADASLRELGSGTVWASGLTDTTKKCEQLLCLTYDLFVNSFCAEQKGLAFLQFRSNVTRQQEVSRMLGFDRLETAEKLATDRRKDFASRRDQVERSLGDPDLLHAELIAAENRLADVEAFAKESAEQRDKVAAQVGPAAETRAQAERWLALSADMGEIRQRAEGLKSAVQVTELLLVETRAEAEELRGLVPQEAEFQAAETRLAELARLREEEREREAAAVEAKRLETEAAEAETQATALAAPDLAALNANLSARTADRERLEAGLKAALETWNDERRKAEAEFAAVRARAETAVRALQRAQEAAARGVCPECGQPTIGNDFFSGRRLEAEELQREQEAKRERVAGLEPKPGAVTEAERVAEDAVQRVREAREAKEAGGRIAAQADSLRERAKGLGAHREALLKKLAQTPGQYDAAEHERLQARRTELKTPHERFLAIRGAETKLVEREKAHAEAKVEYDTAKERYREMEAQRKELSFESQPSANEAVAAHQALLEESARVEEALRGAEAQRAFALEARANARVRIEEHKVRAEELKTLRTQEVLHDVAAKEFRVLRMELNRTLGPELAARASENLALLTNGRYPEVELDKQFGASLIEEGVAKSVISGGEEDVVALALRLALSELIQERQGRPMSLLILDEVFGSLDADRRQSVLDRLAVLKGRFQQILVISHIEEINQVADQCLYLARHTGTRATVVSNAPPRGFEELL